MFIFRKNIKFIFFSLVIFLLIVFFILQYVNSKGDIVKVNLGGKIFQSEVVSSRNDLEKGLGGRNSMCFSCGMLFRFSQSGKYSFWMKDMRFPIDILWIYQGRIVHLEKNVSPSYFGILVPLALADHVLEINAGRSDELGIKVGDRVRF